MIAIRRALPAEASGLCHVVETIVAEGIYTAIARAWTVEEQASYLRGLTHREAVFAAFEGGSVIGFQVIDRWAALDSMAHVGQIGTFLLPAWRGQGIGSRLFGNTLPFASEAGYRKLLIQVRAGNTGALAFYRRLQFVECGRLRAQVQIGGVFEDEILLERPVEL